MTGTTMFPRSSFVGFDHLLSDLQFAATQKDNYPPHNIYKVGEEDYMIELAVSGFSRDELTIEVKDRTLTVSGEWLKERGNREYIHRGISTKKFKRTFRLSEHIEVFGAAYRDGILSIALKYVVPESLRPRLIQITNNEENQDDGSNDRQLLTE